MLAPTLQLAEPIAGYTITERIGTGGYGEVWKAQAPGGLSKAIKFVYGRMDDERAMCELKALHRIKEVRHPFLLSLERIEVVDGQLVILTELADGSLKDRFQQCRAQGLPGIPRDELLVYLHDAAEALDYMSEQYSLQHLDVKPENLLIVGGRVKVADFGLVKKIEDRTVSLLGGLTPVYAAPESFDGHPSRHSDQYSLAIVYQEMLTGVVPFPGKTTAQLMSQHLYSRPRLASLPPADQPIVARALGKNPDERFSSCREMIDRLVAAGRTAPSGPVPREAAEADDEPLDTIASAAPSSGTAADPEPAPASATSWGGENPPTLKTLALDEAVRAPARPVATEPRPCEPEPDRVLVDLPPLELGSPKPRLCPTLYLGIGGTATRVLARLRRRLHDRLGKLSAAPALQMLLLDTDLSALEQATRGDESAAFESRQTLGMPLRQPQEYREASDRLLRWLSRRWLYNIPRSLQTEGIRPLGRLALADHSEVLFRRLRAVLDEIRSPEALSATANSTGIEDVDPAPRVFVIASISGGTGSGMVLDAGYAVRHTLRGLGLPEDRVYGVLTHSTVRNPNAKGLAIANAYACLHEAEHYRRAGRYPGDPACGLPPFENDSGPFQTYLVHLGEDLNETQYEAAVEAVAEYLYLDAITTAGRFLDAGRRSPGDKSSRLARGTVRTFAVAQIGYSQSAVTSAATETLCARVVRRWCGEGASRDDARSAFSWAVGPTHSSPDMLPLELESWRAQAEAYLHQELGGDIESFFRGALDRLGSGAGQSAPPSAPQVLGMINALLGDRLSPGDSATSRIQTSLAKELKNRAAVQGASLGQWILELADASVTRLDGARMAVQWAADRLRSLEAEADAALRDDAPRLAQAERQLLDGEPAQRTGPMGWLGIGRSAKRPPAQDLWFEHFRRRLGLLALRGTILWLRALRAHVVGLGDRLVDLRRRLVALSDQFLPEPPLTAPPEPPESASDLSAVAAFVLRGRMDELAAALDRAFHATFLAPRGGLRGLLDHEGDLRALLVDPLRAAARRTVLDALGEIDLKRALLPPTGSDDPAAGLRAWLEAARPPLAVCGGGRRTVLVCPKACDAARLVEAVAKESGQRPVVLPDSDIDLVLCVEVEGIPLLRAATSLLSDRPDCADIASRLHTRTDVPWSRF